MTAALRIAACLLAAASAWAAARLVFEALERRRRVSHARAITLEDVLSDRTLSFALFAGAGSVVAAATALWLLPALLVLAWALARKAPELLERRRRDDLRAECDGQLDVMADVVALGVRAGLSFDAALDVYCRKFDGELSRRMHAARLSYANGMASREQALMDVARDVDSKALHRFVETSVQAVRYGSPLAELLAKFSEDVRRERRANVERQVARAPVKMLVPLGGCILPALLIFVAGPVMLQFLETGM